MTLDSSGNLLVGTTTSESGTRLFISGGALKVTGYGSTSYSNGAYIEWNKNADGSGATSFVNQRGGGAGGFKFLEGETNGTFSERARIDSNGNLLVGTTASTPNPGFFLSPTGYFNIGNNAASTGFAFASFIRSTTTIGSITQSGTTAVLYNVTSDERLKENIVDAPEFGSVIDSIQVRSYDWKSDGSHQRAGFVAQELITVAPEAVHQPSNEDDMMAVDYSKLVPMLVKEIQSLRKRLADAGI
jgi:hypothetical protein